MFIYSLAAAEAAGSLLLPISLVIMVLAFYFFGIRPQKKQEREVNAMRNALTVGDEITTIGGIVGKIVSIDGELITFETGEDRVRMQVKKWAISTTAKLEAEEEAKTKRR